MSSIIKSSPVPFKDLRHYLVTSVTIFSIERSFWNTFKLQELAAEYRPIWCLGGWKFSLSCAGSPAIS